MFKTARIKLTAWYLLIIMLISITFSVIIYSLLIHELNRFNRLIEYRNEQRIKNNFIPAPPRQINLNNPELIIEIKSRIILWLAFINIIILLISAWLGYFLAGITLLPIKSMLDEQNRFISDASHELKTPLTIMKTSLEVFLRNKKPTLLEAKNVIKENIAEVNNLQKLSESLLQLTQHQTIFDQTQFQIINSIDIISDAIKKILPLANQKHIIINNSVTDFQIKGNRHNFIDLFVILLENAIKYSQNNKIIQINQEDNDKFNIVSIIDQGIGISKLDIPHIFNRFWRADNARTKKAVNGYGLGLSIAKKIITNHNGIIKVESEFNKGTKFMVYLPKIKNTNK